LEKIRDSTCAKTDKISVIREHSMLTSENSCKKTSVKLEDGLVPGCNGFAHFNSKGAVEYDKPPNEEKDAL
jgi:hypothetical protein